jgi:uncharacterized damage-inducible protein DinB
MQVYGAKNMADSWRTVRKNTIQIADDIPEDKYGFKAAPETMTVGQLLAHIAASTHWAEQAHFLDKKNEISADAFGKWFGESGKLSTTLVTKADILAALRARGDAFAAHLEGAPETLLAETVTLPGGTKSRFEMLLGVKEHEMHHRGQLMQMERMLGIVPHLTRARQAR